MSSSFGERSFEGSFGARNFGSSLEGCNCWGIASSFGEHIPTALVPEKELGWALIGLALAASTVTVAAAAAA